MNKILKSLILLSLLLLSGISLPSISQADMIDQDTAVLRALDNRYARTQLFETPLNQSLKFGRNLYIRVRACRKSQPFDAPEAAAFLEVWTKDDVTEESTWIFSGWMFASSPALSAMNHPAYDIWVVDCKNASTSEKETVNPAG